MRPSSPASLTRSSASFFCSIDSVKVSTSQPKERAACQLGRQSVASWSLRALKTHLDCEPSPSTAKFKNSVPRLNASCSKDVMNFAKLSSFQVSRNRTHFQIASNSTLSLAPKCTRVHHLLAQESLKNAH